LARRLGSAVAVVPTGRQGAPAVRGPRRPPGPAATDGRGSAWEIASEAGEAAG